MKAAAIFMFALIPATAQSPLVHLVNLSRPFTSELQPGDRFEIQITAAPHQPISVRTIRQGQTDWGPVIGSTDSTGRWSTVGQFEKTDFGAWTEIWTVGGKLATPDIQFYVKAPCLPGVRSLVFISGPNEMLICGTADAQSFATPSLSDPFRTPDGRVIPGRPAEQTQEQYHMQILTDVITANDPEAARISLSSSKGALGDGTADLIGKMIGANALSVRQAQNVLALIRTAFEKPERIAPDSREPTATLVLLRRLAELTDDDNLKQQIAETTSYVQAR